MPGPQGVSPLPMRSRAKLLPMVQRGRQGMLQQGVLGKLQARQSLHSENRTLLQSMLRKVLRSLRRVLKRRPWQRRLQVGQSMQVCQHLMGA